MANKAGLKNRKLPIKSVRAPDGTLVQLKVVRADSDNFAAEFLAAFQSNVRRVRSQQRKGQVASADAAKA